MHYKINKESFIRLSSNLILNAIKYTNRNGFIDIRLKDNQLIVQDSGIGIRKDKQKEIFSRFYRATSNEGGFGIGLDIVKTICVEYNLEIVFNSTQDKGTTFIIKF